MKNKVIEKPYDKLLGRKLTEDERERMERNLCGFVELLMEIDDENQIIT